MKAYESQDLGTTELITFLLKGPQGQYESGELSDAAKGKPHSAQVRFAVVSRFASHHPPKELISSPMVNPCPKKGPKGAEFISDAFLRSCFSKQAPPKDLSGLPKKSGTTSPRWAGGRGGQNNDRLHDVFGSVRLPWWPHLRRPGRPRPRLLRCLENRKDVWRWNERALGCF